MLAAVLLLVGAVLLLIGLVMILVSAFKVSIARGLGVLILWPVGLVLLGKSWKESKLSFLLQLVGAILIGAGILLGPPVSIP